MKGDTLIKELDCEILYRRKEGGTKDLRSFIASDLMSDVLLVDNEIDILITSLSTAQAIRTADIVSAIGVVIVNGKPVSADMKAAAKEFDITLLRTKLSTFEACGIIHRLKERSA